ncbi:hypothetical protein [Streptomyces sp. NPDC003832]
MTAPDQWGQGVAVWQLTDPPSIPGAAAALADGIIPRSLLRYASAAARNAAIDTPEEGMHTWLIAEARLEIYHSGAWLPWPPIPVQTFQVSDAPYNQTQVTVDYSNSAWPRPQFVAPPSGRAYVTISAGLANTNTDSSTVWAAWRATGSLGFSYSDLNRTGLSAQAKRIVASKRSLLTGMTAGETITIIPQWNISSGSTSTAETFAGSLLIEPAP